MCDVKMYGFVFLPRVLAAARVVNVVQGACFFAVPVEIVVVDLDGIGRALSAGLAERKPPASPAASWKWFFVVGEVPRQAVRRGTCANGIFT